MRMSAMYIPIRRQKQIEAELASHQLLLRAGYIRRVAAGLYGHLPMMQLTVGRVADRFRGLFRILGGLEISLPHLPPSGESVLCGLRETMMTSLVAGELRSYRDLPQWFFQIGPSFRAEARPRFGMLLARESVSVEGYVFAADSSSMDETTTGFAAGVMSILDGLGIAPSLVKSPSGQQIVVALPGEIGDNTVLICPRCGYTAGAEAADFSHTPNSPTESEQPLERIATPGATTIEQISGLLHVEPERIVKTIICRIDDRPVAALVRGDRELNLFKLRAILGAVRADLADAALVQQETGAPVGFAGPVGLSNVTIIADRMVGEMCNFVVGANAADYHFINANPGRDFEINRLADISVARGGDGCPDCGGVLSESRCLTIAETRIVGSRIPEELNARYTTEAVSEQPLHLGGASVDLSRLIQALVELKHDEKGIVWPAAIAPFPVQLMLLNVRKDQHLEVAERLYRDLTEAGIDTLYDDRPLRPGPKFADAELIGLPLRLVIGDKSMKDGLVELQFRDGRASEMVAPEAVQGRLNELLEDSVR